LSDLLASQEGLFSMESVCSSVMLQSLLLCYRRFYEA